MNFSGGSNYFQKKICLHVISDGFNVVEGLDETVNVVECSIETFNDWLSYHKFAVDINAIHRYGHYPTDVCGYIWGADCKVCKIKEGIIVIRGSNGTKIELDLSIVPRNIEFKFERKIK